MKDYVPWCTTIAAHPDRPGLILAGHGWLWRTLDAGVTPWQRHSRQPLEDGFTHSDIQAIVFVPGRPNEVYVATDGGVYRTRDVTAPLPARGGIWKHCSSGLDVTQCYTVAVAPARPLQIGVTSQDLGAYVYQGGDDDTIDPAGLWDPKHHWEGGWIEFDPGARGAFYLDTRKGSDEEPDWLRHWADDGHGWASPGFPDAGGTHFQSDCTIREAMAIAGQRPERRLLIAKLHDPKQTLPANPVQVYASSNSGATWQPSAEVEDPVAVEVSADGQRAYAAGRTVALWTRIDAGPWRRLQLSRPLPALPVNDIEISPADSRVIYVALGGADIASGTSQGVIFPTDERAVWQIVVGNDDQAVAEPVSGAGAGALPPRLPITGIEIDPRHPERLFASHLTGVHRSLDGGQSWAPFVGGLPNTFVADLDLHELSRTLYAATMGRGVTSACGCRTDDVHRGAAVARRA